MTSTVEERFRITRKWIIKDTIKDAFAYNGEAQITRKIYSIDSTLLSQEDIRDAVIFKDKFRNRLRFFPDYGSAIDVLFTKSSYQLKIHYWHPQNDFGNKGIDVNFSESSLIFKNDSFQIGDTVLGYIKILTKPYIRNHDRYIDSYEGYFTSIVFEKDSISKYPIRIIQ